MAWSAVAFFLLATNGAGAAASGGRSAASVTPIQKVLTLMNDMLAKGIKEKKDEEVKFSAFDTWCTNTKRVKTEEIKVGAEKIEDLEAESLKAESTIKKTTDRINELEEDVGRWEKDIKAATEVHQKEQEDYSNTQNDFQESITALGDAIAVMKKQAYDRTQPEFVQTLLQLKARPSLPKDAKSALTAFLQQPSVEAMPDEQLAIRAPEAYSYEFQSGGVVDMLVKLKDQFDSKMRDCVKEQLKTRSAFEQMAQQLHDNIENAKNEINMQSERRAEHQQLNAEKEAEKAQTEEEKSADMKYLDETNILCDQKTSDFKSRQELRAGEIKTLEEAIKLISSGTVKGAGEKYLPALLQVRGKALAQVQSNLRSPLQARIAAFLAERARISGSRLLAQVSQRVQADPFVKVKKLIKDLISQLMEEGTSETEHKGWCDSELATNKVTTEARTRDVESLKTKIDDLTAQITQLTQDLADLATEIKELEDDMAEATKERTESKATNEKTVEEAKQAQTAVQQALAVVKDFYAKSAQATALAQQPASDAPETFDKPYKGMLPEGGNVVDFLEVILTDFNRLDSETSAAEAAEADAYDKFMFESKKDKAVKENSSKHKTSKKSDSETELHNTEEELKSNQEQLSAALAYYEKLKPTCVDSGITYEERVKRREEEMQSLKEALKILSGEDIA